MIAMYYKLLSRRQLDLPYSLLDQVPTSQSQLTVVPSGGKWHTLLRYSEIPQKFYQLFLQAPDKIKPDIEDLPKVKAQDASTFLIRNRSNHKW